MLAASTSGIGPLEGPYTFFLYQIPFDHPEESSARRIQISYNEAYGYPGPSTSIEGYKEQVSYYPVSFGSGPCKYFGGWLFSFAFEGNLAYSQENEPFDTRRLVNPIYYLSANGTKAVPWVPKDASYGVLGFGVQEGNLSTGSMYVALAGDDEKLKRLVEKRQVPHTMLQALDSEGKVIHECSIPLHYSSLPVGVNQSIEVVCAEDKVYVLNRVPCALSIHKYSELGKKAFAAELGSADGVPYPLTQTAAFMDIGPYDEYVIAKPRIDVYSLDLKHIASRELHMSQGTGYFYRMDIDAENEEVLVQEYFRGNVFIYDMDLNLKDRLAIRNYGFEYYEFLTQDIVLHNSHVYVAGFGSDYSESGAIIEYPER